MKPVAFITGGVGDIGQAICRHFINLKKAVEMNPEA